MRESESQKKATRNYIQKMYRPSIYIDKNLQSKIESRIAEKGFKSFNEYLHYLLENDIDGFLSK